LIIFLIVFFSINLKVLSLESLQFIVDGSLLSALGELFVYLRIISIISGILDNLGFYNGITLKGFETFNCLLFCALALEILIDKEKINLVVLV
jgi:hypothetical protein